MVGEKEARANACSPDICLEDYLLGDAKEYTGGQEAVVAVDKTHQGHDRACVRCQLATDSTP